MIITQPIMFGTPSPTIVACLTGIFKEDMMMRAPTRAAMATTAFLSGRVGAFVSSGVLWRHAGVGRATTARHLSMAADQEKVGFIGE